MALFLLGIAIWLKDQLLSLFKYVCQYPQVGFDGVNVFQFNKRMVKVHKLFILTIQLVIALIKGSALSLFRQVRNYTSLLCYLNLQVSEMGIQSYLRVSYCHVLQ